MKGLLFCILITACSFNVQTEDPVSAVKSFAAAIETRDFAKAEKYVSDTYRPDYEILKESKKEKPGMEINIQAYTYTLKKKTASRALVYSGYIVAGTEEGADVYLSKQKGKWLIDSVIFVIEGKERY